MLHAAAAPDPPTLRAEPPAMTAETCPLPDLAATHALGARLAPLLRAGDTVALGGDLGAGKSELARAVLRARLDDPALDVPSPTFTLVQTYDAPDGLALWHVDLYRLETPEDALELGLEEAFADAAVLIEWPDRLGPFLPRDRLDIALAVADAETGARTATLTPSGGDWAERLRGAAP